MFENRSNKELILIYIFISLLVTAVLVAVHLSPMYPPQYQQPVVVVVMAVIEFFLIFYILYLPLKAKKMREKKEKKESEK